MLSGLPITSFARNPDRTWTLTWDPVPGATSYRVILFGSVLGSTAGTSYTVSLPNYNSTPPPVEIVSDGVSANSELFPASFTMQWYGEPCSRYHVEQQNDDGTYTDLTTVNENGAGVYTTTVRFLTDGHTYTYGVQADNQGLLAQVQDYTVTVVTTPVVDESALDIVYDVGSENIIITGI